MAFSPGNFSRSRPIPIKIAYGNIGRKACGKSDDIGQSHLVELAELAAASQRADDAGFRHLPSHRALLSADFL
jgi:hypothetical protein